MGFDPDQFDVDGTLIVLFMLFASLDGSRSVVGEHVDLPEHELKGVVAATVAIAECLVERSGKLNKKPI